MEAAPCKSVNLLSRTCVLVLLPDLKPEKHSSHSLLVPGAWKVNPRRQFWSTAVQNGQAWGGKKKHSRTVIREMTTCREWFRDGKKKQMIYYIFASYLFRGVDSTGNYNRAREKEKVLQNTFLVRETKRRSSRRSFRFDRPRCHALNTLCRHVTSRR